MILVSGPTGSGKTTSLYALVRSLETTRRNVVTIEDPVEIQIENVTQIPVDEAHDKSFSSLLRSVLRQDPDVLLVGEVRDAETARIAMQAAITGHLVFSTVHTKDTIGTIFRLLLLVCFRSKASDIHIEPRLDSFQARLRIDGTMVDVMRVPNQLGVKLTTLVKVLSDIDIAHKNTIQEGHFATIVPAPKSKAKKRRVDYRVSFAPALHGQKLVIRILDPSNAPHRIADLQLPSWMYESIGSAIRQDSGMILVSGPTGSGKTTSRVPLRGPLPLW